MQDGKRRRSSIHATAEGANFHSVSVLRCDPTSERLRMTPGEKGSSNGGALRWIPEGSCSWSERRKPTGLSSRTCKAANTKSNNKNRIDVD